MRPATPKQIKFAAVISERTGIPLPDKEDIKLYSEYISNFKDAPDAPRVMFNEGNGEGYIKIILRKMPKHCGECPFYENTVYVDDEPFFGSGESHYCPFGCGVWGCLVERPVDCPIQEYKEKNK
jgi:hypothetical protein